MTFFKLLAFLLVLAFLLPLASAAIKYSDTWTNSNSTFSDGVVWGGYNLNAKAQGLNSQADCLCWDWCDDGSGDNNEANWDQCWCESTTKKNQCSAYSSLMANMDESGKVQTYPILEAYHNIPTGNSGNNWSCNVDVKEFRSCGSTPSTVDHDEKPYYVVNSKRYFCDGELFDIEGQYAKGAFVIWDDDVSCGLYKKCDDKYHNQIIYNSIAPIPSVCSLKDGSDSNYLCLENADCFSGICSGGKEERKNLCNSDGGSNYVYQDRYYADTCGGSGYLSTNWGEETSVSKSCSEGFVCDFDHDNIVVQSPSNPPSPCRKALNKSCSSSSDCWNDDSGNICNSLNKCSDKSNGVSCGVDLDCNSGRCDSHCMPKLVNGSFCDETSDCSSGVCNSGVCGFSYPLCTGKLEALAEDIKGAPVNINAFVNNAFNSSSNEIGQSIIDFKNVKCNEEQNISLKCTNNLTVCGERKIMLNANQTEHLAFDCTVCSSLKDIYISQNNVWINSSSVKVELHSFGFDGSVFMTVFKENNEGIISNISEKNVEINNAFVTNITFTLDSLEPTDFIHVYIDSNDSFVEDDETNNYIFRPAVKPVKAFLDVQVDPGFSVLNGLIEEYLSSFVNRIYSENEADIVIIVGRKAVLDGGNVKVTDSIGDGEVRAAKNYAGVVKRSGNKVLAYGNGIEGDIAAVKRLVNARSIFLNKNSNHYESIIDDNDILGISVMDLFSQPEIKANKNNEYLKSSVKKILFDNNFEVSVRPVKTLNTTSYGQSTILRVKHVNSDFSNKYKDAVGISSTPVVMAGGIFSNLETWEDNGKGLASNLAKEGYEVWEIELTGGPYTDCYGFEVDNCPNYKFDDLVDYYWPASVAGVMKYANASKVDYVGHSNGGRVALSSLNNYSLNGLAVAGQYFDYSDGQYKNSYLPANPVRKLFGVAVPVVANGNTPFTESLRYQSNDTDNSAGNITMSVVELLNFINNKTHLRKIQFSIIMMPQVPIWISREAALDPITTLASRSKFTISHNLMRFYNNLANDNNSQVNLSNMNVTELYLYNAEPHDIIVPIEDQEIVMEQVVMVGDDSKFRKNYQISGLNVIRRNHGALISNTNVHDNIKENLK